MKMLTKKGFSLMELVVVVIIVGILAGIMFPQFVRSRESAMDRQAESILKTIRAAQRAYHITTGHYYPASGNTNVVADINSNLSLDLVDDGEW
ncbi:type IV pilin protein, partial [Candidatus Omnitrophota bacterium]